MAAITASSRPGGEAFSGEPLPPRPVVVESFEEPPQDADLPMTISGTPEAAAEKVNSVSPEGRPARNDAKSGPGRLAGEMLIAASVILLAAVGIGLYFGVGAGLASLAVGVVALALNPVLGATALRMKDRSEVIHQDEDNARHT